MVAGGLHSDFPEEPDADYLVQEELLLKRIGVKRNSGGGDRGGRGGWGRVDDSGSRGGWAQGGNWSTNEDSWYQ